MLMSYYDIKGFWFEIYNIEEEEWETLEADAVLTDSLFDGCFSDDMACIQDDRDKGYYFVNRKTGMIINWNHPYDEAGDFSEGKCCVRGDGWLFLDKEGNNAFGRTFEYADSFRNGIACIGDSKYITWFGLEFECVEKPTLKYVYAKYGILHLEYILKKLW